MNVLGAIGVYSTGQQFAWRGMSSVDYDMWSSLHRSLGREVSEREMRAKEMALVRDARSWGLGLGASSHVDDLQLLADLQHYGIRTRLMDFTSNPMTALWFACQSPNASEVSQSGVLIAMNVSNWPRHATMVEPGGMTWGWIADTTGYRLESALEQEPRFIVESINPNDRLRAQEGFFIAGAIPENAQAPFLGIDIPFLAGDPTALDRRLSAERQRGAPGALPFVAVIVKAGLKVKLLQYLENTYNRTAKVLFPDYAGFLQYGSTALEREHVVDGEPSSDEPPIG